MRFSFTDWHPVFSTLTIWAATRIWANPASVILFQILFYSVVVSFTLVSFIAIGVPRWVLLLLSLAFALFFPNGMLAITMWKDIPYSICVLGLTAILLKILLTRGGWLNHRIHIIILSGFCLGIALLRHNGIPVALSTLCLVLFIYFRYWRSITLSFGIFIICYLAITGPLYQWLQVDRERGQSIGVTLIHPIAAHIAAGAGLTPADTNYLNQIYPISKGWDYSCYDATVLFYKGVNFNPVQRDPGRALNIFWNLTIHQPMVTLNHFICLSSFVWRIDQPQGVYLETVLLNNYNNSSHPILGVYAKTVRTRSKLPIIREQLLKVDQFLMSDPHMILWRPAIYLYILIFTVIFYCFVVNNFHYLLLVVPVIVHSGIVMFFAQLEAVRYQYPVYVITSLFVIPLLWSAISKKKWFPSNRR